MINVLHKYIDFYNNLLHKHEMQNEEIINIISNLKGRRKYEEKKATKLGFSSLYEYFEDRLIKQKKALEDQERQLVLNKTKSKLTKKESTKKNNCGCC